MPKGRKTKEQEEYEKETNAKEEEARAKFKAEWMKEDEVEETEPQPNKDPIKAWNDIFKIWFKLNNGIIRGFYNSFTVKGMLVSDKILGDKIEWTYNFFDKDGKEVFFDIMNEAKVAE